MTTPARRRLDAELVRRGLAPSREQARADIAAGRVRVAGAPASKPAHLVGPGEPLVVEGDPRRYVGRGGDKLAAALEEFSLAVAGRRALDAGAATGGFTDCLLQHGVAQVVAVDVGRGQLHERLRDDVRVILLERTNVRRLEPAAVGGRVDIVVADLSFISLRTVLDSLLGLLRPGGDLVALVKPQFEAGRVEASRGRGVVRDPAVWRRVPGEVSDAIAERGATMMECMVSPLRGAEGNVEFLVHAVPGGGPGVTGADLDAVVASAGRG